MDKKERQVEMERKVRNRAAARAAAEREAASLGITLEQWQQRMWAAARAGLPEGQSLPMPPLRLHDATIQQPPQLANINQFGSVRQTHASGEQFRNFYTSILLAPFFWNNRKECDDSVEDGEFVLHPGALVIQRH